MKSSRIPPQFGDMATKMVGFVKDHMPAGKHSRIGVALAAIAAVGIALVAIPAAFSRFFRLIKGEGVEWAGVSPEDKAKINADINTLAASEERIQAGKLAGELDEALTALKRAGGDMVMTRNTKHLVDNLSLALHALAEGTDFDQTIPTAYSMGMSGGVLPDTLKGTLVLLIDKSGRNNPYKSLIRGLDRLYPWVKILAIIDKISPSNLGTFTATEAEGFKEPLEKAFAYQKELYESSYPSPAETFEARFAEAHSHWILLIHALDALAKNPKDGLKTKINIEGTSLSLEDAFSQASSGFGRAIANANPERWRERVAVGNVVEKIIGFMNRGG